MASPNKIRLHLFLLLLIIGESQSQVGFSQLSKIGIIKAKGLFLKLKGATSKQLMVIKFIPNVANITNCTAPVINDYKQMLDRILHPINSSISQMKSYYTDKVGGVRFIGAVLGGIALGIATSAQITAGFALHNSIQNAKAIKQMKDAIANSNKAIEQLTISGKQTLTAISAMQDQINNQLVPAINELGCDVAKNTLGLRLTQYFSEISLIFGPNLRDPASETISIQAISKAFNNDFESILKTLGYKGTDLLDILESDSIRARIIDVDLEDYFLSLQIEYPSLHHVTDATVQEFSKISYNEKGTEWLSVYPPHILVRGQFLSNIDLTKCVRTTTSYICQTDTSTPMSPALMACTRGETEKCARERVVTSHVSRFALSDGVIYANCMATTCVCVSKDHNILQDSAATNTMISSDFCNEIQVDGVLITVGERKLNRTYYARDVKLGKPISTDPIDIGNQLANAEQSLDKAKEFLDKSNDILKRINPNIVNTGAMIAYLIILIVLGVWSILSLTWLIYLTRKLDSQSHVIVGYRNESTVNSLSSLIPGT